MRLRDIARLGMALAACSCFGQSFEMVGWQLHERQLPKIEDAIRRAPDYGVNFVVFSHELFRSVDEFLKSPERQQEIASAAAACERAGLAYWLWIHELDDIPAAYRENGEARGRVELDRQDLHRYLTQRYERLLAKTPGTAGFVLTFHESGARVFQNSTVRSALTIPERIELVTRLIHGVLRKHKKQLIVRNFFYEPREMEWFDAALSGLPRDIMVMRKDTCHEFHPFYPADPAHGRSGRKELMEVDLGVEKALGWGGHYAQVDFIHRFLRRAREKNLAGVMGRARLLWDEPFEDTHEVNLHAFGQLARDGEATPDSVWSAWAGRRYPEPARPHVIAALRRTEWIMHHGRYVLGYWFNKWLGEQWDDYAYYFSRARLRSNAKWTGDPRDVELQRRLYAPDTALYREALAEKDEVVRQVRASMQDLDAAARYLPPAQEKSLRAGFDWLRDAAHLQREWVRAYFAQRIFVLTGQEDWRAIAEDALRRLEASDRNPGCGYGRDPVSGHRYRIPGFVSHMRWRMANPALALAEDERILDDVRRQLDVESQ